MPLKLKQKRRINIEKDKLEELDSLFSEMYSYAKTNSSQFRDKLKQLQKQTKAVLYKERPKASWQTDVSLPVTKAVVDAIGSRLFLVLYETNQIVDMRPKGQEDVDTVKKIEAWYNDRLMNNSKNFEKNLDKAIKKFLQDGLVIFYTHYVRLIP